MKKTITSTLAILFLALPLSLYAGSAKQASSKTAVVKPLSAMKATMTSPSKSNPPSSKVLDLTTKPSEKVTSKGEQSESTKKLLEEAEKMTKNKGQKK